MYVIDINDRYKMRHMFVLYLTFYFLVCIDVVYSVTDVKNLLGRDTAPVIYIEGF